MLKLSLTLIFSLSSFFIPVAYCHDGLVDIASITKPKLVVNIVVSQLRYDYLLRYSNNLSSSGIKLLIDDGVSFNRAYYNFLNTNSSSGLATLSTGSYPNTHGIIGSQWFNYTTKKKINLLEDKSIYTIGSDEYDSQLSPTGIYASSIGDALKSVSPYSKVISIAFDPTSAILMGGHSADGVYWVNHRQGHFVSNSYYTDKLPQWVNMFNFKSLPNSYSSLEWRSVYPISKYHNINSDIRSSSSKRHHTIDKPRRSNFFNYNRLRATPYGNSLIKDFAIQSIIYEGLGQDDNTDLLNIVFDPFRHIGSKYGSHSMESEDAFYQLDKDISRLIEYLKSQFKPSDLLVILTSDHGASNKYTPNNKIPSGKFNPTQFSILVNSFVGSQLGGDKRWVLAFVNNQIYLDRNLIYKSGRSLESVQNIISHFAIQFRGVSQAITSSSLSQNHYSNGIQGKAQNSFFHRYSGDIILSLLPGWIVDSDKLSDSGSGYNYDTHVPLIFWGGNLTRGTIIRDVDICDVSPTIAHIIGVAPPNASTGKPIMELYIKK